MLCAVRNALFQIGLRRAAEKEIFVPGWPGHRQVLLVNSNSVLCCLTAAGAACGCLPRLPPRRRRAGAVSAQRSPADFALTADAAAALSVRSRSRWTFPKTAERDRPPSRAAIAAAVRPSFQSCLKRSICSRVHDWAGMTCQLRRAARRLRAPVRPVRGSRCGVAAPNGRVAGVTVCDIVPQNGTVKSRF